MRASKIRLYMTFDAEWIMELHDTENTLHEAIKEGLQTYGEVCSSFDYMDGVAIMELVSDDRDGDILKDIVHETLLSSFPTIHESDFDIEIDLDVFLDPQDV